jgi:hypothetical protein
MLKADLEDSFVNPTECTIKTFPDLVMARRQVLTERLPPLGSPCARPLVTPTLNLGPCGRFFLIERTS